MSEERWAWNSVVSSLKKGKGRRKGRQFSEDEGQGQVPEGWEVMKTGSASSCIYLSTKYCQGQIVLQALR